MIPQALMMLGTQQIRKHLKPPARIEPPHVVRYAVEPTVMPDRLRVQAQFPGYGTEKERPHRAWKRVRLFVERTMIELGGPVWFLVAKPERLPEWSFDLDGLGPLR